MAAVESLSHEQLVEMILRDVRSADDEVISLTDRAPTTSGDSTLSYMSEGSVSGSHTENSENAFSPFCKDDHNESPIEITAL